MKLTPNCQIHTYILGLIRVVKAFFLFAYHSNSPAHSKFKAAPIFIHATDHHEHSAYTVAGKATTGYAELHDERVSHMEEVQNGISVGWYGATREAGID